MKKKFTIYINVAVICGFLLTSCFSGKLVTTARIKAVADQVWAYSMSHPHKVPFTREARLCDHPCHEDSSRIFPEDSLAAAKKFGLENGQIAIFIISEGKEIRLK